MINQTDKQIQILIELGWENIDQYGNVILNSIIQFNRVEQPQLESFLLEPCGVTLWMHIFSNVLKWMMYERILIAPALIGIDIYSVYLP